MSLKSFAKALQQMQSKNCIQNRNLNRGWPMMTTSHDIIHVFVNSTSGIGSIESGRYILTYI